MRYVVTHIKILNLLKACLKLLDVQWWKQHCGLGLVLNIQPQSQIDTKSDREAL